MKLFLTSVVVLCISTVVMCAATVAWIGWLLMATGM